MPSIDIAQVASDAAAAMLGVLKTHASDIAAYARAEAEKIAVATTQIAQLRADGIIAAEQAVNAALAVVRLAIEDAIGIAIP